MGTRIHVAIMFKDDIPNGLTMEGVLYALKECINEQPLLPAIAQIKLLKRQKKAHGH